MPEHLQEENHGNNRLWSGNDCIDATLIWLRSHRDRLDDAIAKIEAVRPMITDGILNPSRLREGAWIETEAKREG